MVLQKTERGSIEELGQTRRLLWDLLASYDMSQWRELGDDLSFEVREALKRSRIRMTVDELKAYVLLLEDIASDVLKASSDERQESR